VACEEFLYLHQGAGSPITGRTAGGADAPSSLGRLLIRSAASHQVVHGTQVTLLSTGGQRNAKATDFGRGAELKG
jgi:hypothetical protein